MFPPTCVASCESQSSRNGRLRKTATLLGSGVGDGELARCSRGAASGPRAAKPTRRRSTARRSSRTWRPQVAQRRPMSAPSRSTSQVRAAAWVRAAQLQAVAEPERDGKGHERWRDCIGGEGSIRRRAAGRPSVYGRGSPRTGPSERSAAGTVTASSGVTSTCTSS